MNNCGWVKNGGKCILENEITDLTQRQAALMENLIRSKTKYNNDKARYRRKAKMYRERIKKAIFYMENYISVEEYNEPVKCEFGVILRILRGDNK